jgi:serine/threonine-protein kinase HipA
MDELVHVYVDLNGTPRLCGRMWSRAGKGQETATFEYDKEWLQFEERFSLEPALSAAGKGCRTTARKSNSSYRFVRRV